MSHPFDIAKAPEITAWLESHQKLAHLFSFKMCEGGTPIKLVKQKSAENHITMFSTLMRTIQREKEDAMELLTKASQEKLRKVGNLAYDDMRCVTLARTITFCHHEIQRLNVEYQSMKLDVLLEREEDAECALNFVTSPAIPEECVCVVDKAFFLLDLPSRLSKLGFKINAMSAHVKRLERQLQEVPVAPWATALPDYVNAAIASSSRLFNDELFYVSPLACEVGISRAIFGGFNPAIAQRIDLMLEDKEQFKGGHQDALIRNLCTLVPAPPDESEACASVRLLVFFRIVFDRLYEKTEGHVASPESNDPQVIAQIMRLRNKDIYMPDELAPPCENGDGLMRKRFRESPVFMPAIQFMEQLEFLTNPVDMLFSIHKCLAAINKAALLTKARGREISQRELTTLLSFDDLFALLIGVAVGSDVPELLRAAKFIARYTPKFCLSNSFEYAAAGIESLAVHFRGLKLEP